MATNCVLPTSTTCLQSTADPNSPWNTADPSSPWKKMRAISPHSMRRSATATALAPLRRPRLVITALARSRSSRSPRAGDSGLLSCDVAGHGRRQRARAAFDAPPGIGRRATPPAPAPASSFGRACLRAMPSHGPPVRTYSTSPIVSRHRGLIGVGEEQVTDDRGTRVLPYQTNGGTVSSS